MRKRHWLQRTVFGTAAVRRWAALLAGFAVVFIPARFVISQRCADYICTNGWNPSYWPDAIGAAGSV